MKGLVDRVQETIATRDLLRDGRSILLAVSGGPDSIAMLHALAELAPVLGLRLGVASIDHGVRPAAREETTLVEVAAKTLGLPAVVERLDPPPHGHAEARRLRYAALERARERLDLALVATAHTRTDQAETVLMRIGRGTGLAGLAAIPARRGRIVRPLLDVSREDVLASLASRGIEYARDPSNEDLRTLRARVRHDLLPRLADEWPAIERTLAGLADEARAVSPSPERDPQADAAHALRRALRSVGLSAERRHVDAILRMLGALPRRDPRAPDCAVDVPAAGHARLDAIGAGVDVPASLVPAVVRNRRPGDRLRSGERLKDRFAAVGIPARLRGFVPLVAQGAVVLALPAPFGDSAGATFRIDWDSPLARSEFVPPERPAIR